MSLSYYLEYGRHVARLRRRRRRRAYAPTSNTASHDNHEKVNSWVSFSFLYEYGAPLGGLSDRRSSAIIIIYMFSYENALVLVADQDLELRRGEWGRGVSCPAGFSFSCDFF